MNKAFQLSALALASSLLLITACDRRDDRAATDDSAAVASRDRPMDDSRTEARDGVGDSRLGERTEDAASRAGQAIDDAKITTTIKGKYIGDDALEGGDISVDTEQGVVTLTGTVQSEEAKQRANEIATGVEGVVNVNNQLTVSRR